MNNSGGAYQRYRVEIINAATIAATLKLALAHQSQPATERAFCFLERDTASWAYFELAASAKSLSSLIFSSVIWTMHEV